MNPKYLEYIVVYLSVLVVCVLIGLLARMIVVGAGVDEFTATTVFWAVTALGMIVYAILTLLIEGLFSSTLLKFFREKAQLPLLFLNGSQLYAGRDFTTKLSYEEQNFVFITSLFYEARNPWLRIADVERFCG